MEVGVENSRTGTINKNMDKRMSHVTHTDILKFAEKSVNMRESDVRDHRRQVTVLREKLQAKIKDNPDYKLKKICLSGSLAKGTALRDINDIDVALYVKCEQPEDMKKFIEWLVDEMRELYPNMEPSQIKSQEFSINISYRGSGLDVDVVPILYQGDAIDDGTDKDDEWDGLLCSQDSGKWLKTNIPRHIAFIQARKERNPTHFRQIVRLVKYWVAQRKTENNNFKFKSLMVELIVAHMADKRIMKMNDYIEAMVQFFKFIEQGGLDNIIAFNDYYDFVETAHAAPIRVFDPANSKNNVASACRQSDRDMIIHKCGAAADAIAGADCAPNKEKANEYWRKVFGPSF